jgi:PAS domain S-box-containing protein
MSHCKMLLCLLTCKPTPASGALVKGPAKKGNLAVVKSAQIQARHVLPSTDILHESMQDLFEDEIAILDETGLILAVNNAWERSARANLVAGLVRSGAGGSYLDTCRTAEEAGLPEAAQAYKGVQAVLEGSAAEFIVEYRCDSPAEQRRYLLTVVPLLAELRGAIVSNHRITVSESVREELLTRGGVRALASVSENFLPALVKSLAACLGARHAFLCELAAEEPKKLRLIAHWTGAEFGPMFEYQAEGTPCAQVIEGRFCHFERGVQQLFPADAWLEQIQAESYMAVPLLDTGGRVIGHLGVIDTRPIGVGMASEVTLRLFASRAAPEVERRRDEAFGALQALLIETVKDAIIGTDADQRITTWNPAAEEIYGWGAGEAIGQRMPELLRTELTGLEREAIELASETGEYSAEFAQYRKDGSRVEIGGSGRALRGPDGIIRGWVAVNRDISERKATQRRLQEALTAKDQFLSLVSHELRTPIAVILGNAWLLESAQEGKTSKQDPGVTGHIVREEAMKLQAIIENLLLLARSDKDDKMDVGPVRLSRVARKALKRRQWPQHHEVRLDSRDESTIAFGNEVAIEEVIQNLVSNAEKYSPAGSVISLSIHQDGAEIILSISDKGFGIPSAALPKLFDPFFRAEEVSALPGMGIGLTVCQRLVAAMGGRIWAANIDGGGARFSFSLPAVP